MVSVVIKKQEFIDKYGKLADDPYELSLSFLLERVLMEVDCGGNSVDVMIESRGVREDAILLKRYNQLIDLGTSHVTPNQFQARFSGAAFKRKRENDCGLQIADLCAYPVARRVLSPREPYPAYDIVATKFRRKKGGGYLGYGLKVFP